MMQSAFPFIPIALFAAAISSSQADNKIKLRVGYAQKPHEAAAELDAIRKATPSVTQWEQRRKTLIAGILAGAKLAKLPKRTPLNPRFVK